MTSFSGGGSTNKLKFSVESILSLEPKKESIDIDRSEKNREEPPCAGCVTALYRCCRDESAFLPLPIPLSYTHLHPALRPTTGWYSFYNILPFRPRIACGYFRQN